MSTYRELWPLITPETLTELVTNLGWEPPNGNRTFIPAAKRGDWTVMMSEVIEKIARGEGVPRTDILDVLCGMVGLVEPTAP